MNSSSTVLRPIAAMLAGLALAAGAEENGFVNVESGKCGGWVKKILVTK